MHLNIAQTPARKILPRLGERLLLRLLRPMAVLENRILPSLYRSRKHSDKDVSSVVIHCRKFFSHFPHIGFGRITHNASLPDRWLQQVIFTFDCDCSCYCLNQASLTIRTRGRAGKFPVGGNQ